MLGYRYSACATVAAAVALSLLIGCRSVVSTDAGGNGNTLDDIVITGPSSLELRSERQGGGNGRVYGIRFEVIDDDGNASIETCFIGVPHDQRGADPIDDGPEAGYTVP